MIATLLQLSAPDSIRQQGMRCIDVTELSTKPRCRVGGTLNANREWVKMPKFENLMPRFFVAHHVCETQRFASIRPCAIQITSHCCCNAVYLQHGGSNYFRPEMTMGQWVTGHGSNGSTNLYGSHGSRVSTGDPLTHDKVNMRRTG